MLVTQHLGHPFSYFMAHLAQQDADTNRLLTNTAPAPNGDLQGASDLGASPPWRTAGGAAQGPRLHGSTDPVKAGRRMCQSSFYYKSTLKKKSRRGEEESRNALFEVGLK